METILQPKARPFESLKRKRFREWLRPSTAHGSLLHSDTLDLRDFAKPNPADTFSNLDSGHCPLVTTPIKYECPDGKSSFSEETLNLKPCSVIENSMSSKII